MKGRGKAVKCTATWGRIPQSSEPKTMLTITWSTTPRRPEEWRGPGRKHGTPVSGWQQQLVSRIGFPDHSGAVKTDHAEKGHRLGDGRPWNSRRRQCLIGKAPPWRRTVVEQQAEAVSLFLAQWDSRRTLPWCLTGCRAIRNHTRDVGAAGRCVVRDANMVHQLEGSRSS